MTVFSTKVTEMYVLYTKRFNISLDFDRNRF